MISLQQNQIKRIALWQTAFLGDAVLTLPLVQTLARSFPEAALDFYVRKGVGNLFTPHPAINRVIEVDKRGQHKGLKGIFKLAGQIRESQPDLLLSAHASFRSAAVARLSGVPMRIGYNQPWFNPLCYTHSVSRRFEDLAEIERLLQLLLPLNIQNPDTWPQITLDPGAKTKAEQFWKEHAQGKVLGVHPGSVWPTKRWPEESFAAILQRFLDQEFTVLVFAGPGEEQVSRRVIDLSQRREASNLFDFSGALSLPELTAFISRLDCYLTNDSGPMHLAWAQHVPVVALFGPTVRSLGFYPQGDRSIVLEAELPCRPCGLHGPKQCPLSHHRCMQDITPDQVQSALRQILARCE